MKKNIFNLVLIIVINSGLFAQARVDYFPKPLRLEFTNKSGDEPKLRELKHSDAFAHSVKSGKYFHIDDIQNLSPLKYIYVGRVNACRAGGCSIDTNTETEADASSEYFDYYILFDSTLSILKVKIFNYQATHGYEVTSANWLKQFKNYNGSKELIVGKNVDAISGATISVAATTADIEHKTQLLRSIMAK